MMFGSGRPTYRAGFMKGGKRDGAGRKPSADPHTARVTVRLTPQQQAKLKALGGAVWLREQIHLGHASIKV